MSRNGSGGMIGAFKLMLFVLLYALVALAASAATMGYYESVAR